MKKEHFVVGDLHRNPERLEEIKNPIKTINNIVKNFTVKKRVCRNLWFRGTQFE
jgi:hypothetical protein